MDGCEADKIGRLLVMDAVNGVVAIMSVANRTIDQFNAVEPATSY